MLALGNLSCAPTYTPAPDPIVHRVDHPTRYVTVPGAPARSGTSSYSAQKAGTSETYSSVIRHGTYDPPAESFRAVGP